MWLRRCVWLTAVIAAIGMVQVTADELRRRSRKEPPHATGHRHRQEIDSYDEIYIGYPVAWRQYRYHAREKWDFNLPKGPAKFISAVHDPFPIILGENPAIPVCLVLIAVCVPFLVADSVCRRLAPVRTTAPRLARLGRLLVISAAFGYVVAGIEFETEYPPGIVMTPVRVVGPLKEIPRFNRWINYFSYLAYDREKKLDPRFGLNFTPLVDEQRWPLRTHWTTDAAILAFLLALPLFRPWRRSRVKFDTPSPHTPSGFPPELIGAPPPANVKCD